MANEQCFNFAVQPGTYVVVSGVNLDDEDVLDLWRLACPQIECDPATELWIPYRPFGVGCSTTGGCVQVSLTEQCNPLIVQVPGRYQLRFRGMTNPNVTVCVGDPIPVAATTHIHGV